MTNELVLLTICVVEFKNKLDTFRPREFILEKLSIEKRTEAMKELIETSFPNKDVTILQSFNQQIMRLYKYVFEYIKNFF